MGIERRGNQAYFYRKKRFGRRVVSVYAGSGEGALLEASAREEDRLRRLEQRAELDRLMAAEQRLIEAYNRVELIFRAAMTAAGYHKHCRGQWRKRRWRI